MPTLGSLLLQQHLQAAQREQERQDQLAQQRIASSERAGQMAYQSQLDTGKALDLETAKRDTLALKYGQAKGELGEEASPTEGGEVTSGTVDTGELVGRAIDQKHQRELEKAAANEELRIKLAQMAADRQVGHEAAVADRQLKNDERTQAFQEMLYKSLKPDLDKGRLSNDLVRIQAQNAGRIQAAQVTAGQRAQQKALDKPGYLWKDQTDQINRVRSSLAAAAMSGDKIAQQSLGDLRQLDRLVTEARALMEIDKHATGADPAMVEEQAYERLQSNPKYQALMSKLMPLEDDTGYTPQSSYEDQ